MIEYWINNEKHILEHGAFYRIPWDKLSRNAGPTAIEYYNNKKIFREWYRTNSYYHKEDGPIYIEYFENGEVNEEETVYSLLDTDYTKDQYYFIVNNKLGNVIFDKWPDEFKIMYDLKFKK